MPVIPASQEAEAGESLKPGRRSSSDSPASASRVAGTTGACHHAQKNNRSGRARWLTPVMPTLWEAKEGGSPELWTQSAISKLEDNHTNLNLVSEEVLQLFLEGGHLLSCKNLLSISNLAAIHRANGDDIQARDYGTTTAWASGRGRDATNRRAACRLKTLIAARSVSSVGGASHPATALQRCPPQDKTVPQSSRAAGLQGLQDATPTITPEGEPR
ncbi:putative uncharacterized protein C8orf44 [Plecturocebus cupreus]